MTGLREGREESAKRIEQLQAALCEARNLLAGIYSLEVGAAVERLDALLDADQAHPPVVDLMEALKAALAARKVRAKTRRTK